MQWHFLPREASPQNPDEFEWQAFEKTHLDISNVSLRDRSPMAPVTTLISEHRCLPTSYQWLVEGGGTHGRPWWVASCDPCSGIRWLWLCGNCEVRRSEKAGRQSGCWFLLFAAKRGQGLKRGLVLTGKLLLIQFGLQEQSQG
jgi:hypothetical protein